MTAFIVSSIVTMLLLLLAQVLLNWQLGDAHKRLDTLRNYTVSLECEIHDLQNRIYRLEKKGGAE